MTEDRRRLEAEDGGESTAPPVIRGDPAPPDEPERTMDEPERTMDERERTADERDPTPTGARARHVAWAKLQPRPAPDEPAPPDVPRFPDPPQAPFRPTPAAEPAPATPAAEPVSPQPPPPPPPEAPAVHQTAPPEPPAERTVPLEPLAAPTAPVQTPAPAPSDADFARRDPERTTPIDLAPPAPAPPQPVSPERQALLSRPAETDVPSAVGRLVAVIVTCGLGWAVATAVGIWLLVFLISRG